MSKRIYLSPPHMSGREQEFIQETFESNWLAPLGPQVDAFEAEFAAEVEAGHALAMASGTAALHLALIQAGVRPGDEVMASTLTFAGSVFPIVYAGARPVFVDSELVSWNMDPALLAEALEKRAKSNRLPRAVILVHLYGQCAEIDAVAALCRRYEVALIEDAAEALGARYRGKPPGSFGLCGIFSFNGNKIITTTGGGMLVSDDAGLIAQARKLASQAREPFVHYEHAEVGYNYRMSSVLAAIGRGQLTALAERVAAKRRNYAFYRQALGNLPGIGFMPEAPWSYSTHWLTVLTIDPEQFGADREQVRQALEAANIESRPVWKPMHQQPVFAGCETIGGEIADRLFERGLCLPSGSSLSLADLERIAEIIESAPQVRPT